MGDTLGVRASQELQDRFKEFADSGDFRSHSDFLNHLLILHAAQETSIRIPTLEGAVSAVTHMADQVCKILIGTGETINVNQEKFKEQLESQRQEAEKKVKSIACENENLKAKIEEHQLQLAAFKESLSEIEEHARSLEGTLADKLAIIDGNLDKISSLEAENNRNKGLIEEAASNMNELENLRYTAKEQALKIKEQEVENEKKFGELEKTLRHEIGEQQAKVTAITNDYEKRLLEKEKSLIELEKSLTNEMSVQQSAYAESIKEYENRVKDLFDERHNPSDESEKTINDLRNEIVKLQEDLEEAKKPKTRAQRKPKAPAAAATDGEAKK